MKIIRGIEDNAENSKYFCDFPYSKFERVHRYQIMVNARNEKNSWRERENEDTVRYCILCESAIQLGLNHEETSNKKSTHHSKKTI